MAQIWPTEMADPGALQKVFPRGPESGGRVKDARNSARLLASAPQHTHSFVIERHMTGLTILGVSAFDSEQPAIEVQGSRIKYVTPMLPVEDLCSVPNTNAGHPPAMINCPIGLDSS
jgi:hypothetical protein